MCGFKWVLTNHGIAEWAVRWRAKGENCLTGAPPSGFRRTGGGGNAVYLLCSCLSAASLSLQSAVPSDPGPGWMAERDKEANYRQGKCNYLNNTQAQWTNKFNYIPSVRSRCSVRVSASGGRFNTEASKCIRYNETVPSSDCCGVTGVSSKRHMNTMNNGMQQID